MINENIITLKGTIHQGKYQTETIQIDINKEDKSITLNGKELTNCVGCYIEILPHNLPIITLKLIDNKWLK